MKPRILSWSSWQPRARHPRAPLAVLAELQTPMADNAAAVPVGGQDHQPKTALTAKEKVAASLKAVGADPTTFMALCSTDMQGPQHFHGFQTPTFRVLSESTASALALISHERHSRSVRSFRRGTLSAKTLTSRTAPRQITMVSW